MTEPTELKNHGKSPVESAANKIRESLQKDVQKKIDDQVKKTLDALRIFKNEKALLQKICEESESDKVDLKDLLEEIA